MTSGARYQRVATYSVMNPLPPLGPASGGGRAALRARPKSQIWCELGLNQDVHQLTLRSQLAFRRRLDGLRSRWRTLAECSALRPRIV